MIPAPRRMHHSTRAARGARRRALQTRALLTVALAGSLADPAPLRAQGVDGGNAHKLRYSLLGALVGSALATGYYAISDPADRRDQGCKPWSCALPYLAGSGALTGLFLSRELAIQRQANIPRLGAREKASFTSAPVVGVAGSIAVRDSLVAVLSDSGVTLYAAGARPTALRRRGAGLAGVRQVALPSTDRLVLGSASALYSGNSEAGTFTRLLPGPVSALASTPTATGSRPSWLVARGRVVQLVTAGVEGNAVSVGDSLMIEATARIAAHDAGADRWWIGTDSTVIEVLATNGVLRTGRRLMAPAPVHALAASADYVAAALDDQRLLVWSRRALDQEAYAASVLDLGSAYPYDIAFRGRDLLVAAGTEGLLRVGIEPTLNVRAVVAELPFVTLVTVDAQQRVWVVDRNKRALLEVKLPETPVYK